MSNLAKLTLALGFGLFLAGCSHEVRYQPPPPVTGENITDLKEAWVELYSEPGFRGRTLTIKYPKGYSDLSAVPADDGTKDFGSKAQSVKWQIPQGWQAVMFSGSDYKGDKFPLFGTGKVESNSDLGAFNGQADSVRFERKTTG
jgi:hypothetical protein